MGSVLVDDERADEGTGTDGDKDHSEAVVEDREIHRLRDLDRGQRLIAAAFGLALLLAPLLAFARYLPDWAPMGDPALMGQRALDVGTGRTPLLGQPSTAAFYVDEGSQIHHLGPLHFYMMAPAIKLLGLNVGMLLVSVVIVGSSLLVAAWATFRQLGLTAVGVGVVVLGAVTFTTGASSLVNPVSSSIAGYPMLCSAVLLWCLLCGDLRLLPLAAGWVSFTAQQHLSVLPALVVLTAVPVAGCLVLARRDRRTLLRWGGAATGLAFVMWLPVILQELFGENGNLTELRSFASNSDRPKLGYRVAFDQVVHALGWPPFLGKTDLGGEWFFGTPSLTTRLSAALVVGLLCFGALRWYRAGNRRRVALVVLALVTAVGGVFNGASVPKGIEQFRMPFYHWSFAMMFFVLLSLALLVGDLLAPVIAKLWDDTWPRRLAVTVPVLLLVIVPAAINPSLDRNSNTLRAAYSPVTRDRLEQIGDAVMAERGRLDGPVLVVARGKDTFVGVQPGVALELADRGLDVVYPKTMRTFVHDDHLAHRSTVKAGIVVVLDNPINGDTAAAINMPGELLIDVGRPEGFDSDALDELVATAEAADEVRLRPETEQMIEDYPDPAAEGIFRGYLDSFVGPGARESLTNPDSLRFLLDTLPIEPAFDEATIRRVLESLPDQDANTKYGEKEWRLRIYLLDQEEVREFAGAWEIFD